MVSVVHTVTIRSAVFCVICSLFLMLVVTIWWSTKQIQPVRGWCATVKRDCANCIHLSRFSGDMGPPIFGKPVCEPAAWLGECQLLVGDKTKPTLKPFYTHTLIHQSNPLNPPQPHSPQPTHLQTHSHLSIPLCPLCKTHLHTIYHLFNCTHLYTSSNILDPSMSPGRVVPLLAMLKGCLAGLP